MSGKLEALIEERWPNPVTASEVAELKMAEWRIVEIIPALGWYAQFLEEESHFPLSCWALMERLWDPQRKVVGLLADGRQADQASSFEGYVHHSQIEYES